jgi:glycosyltransferase involved in cell wall biosynthesis
MRRPSRLRRRSTGVAPAEAHVLIILENMPVGTDGRVRKEIQELLRAGYRVSVVTQAAAENDQCRSWPGLSLLEYPAPLEPRSSWGYLWEYAVSFAWAAVRSGAARLRGRIDVLQVVQPPDFYFPLARLHKLLGAAVVVDQHDLMPELFTLRQGPVRPVIAVLHWLERRTQRVADETICTNDLQKDRLIAAGGDPGRVTVVRNGPVLGRVQAAVPDPSLKDGRSFLCCWVGAMGRQDRLDLAVRAVEHVVRSLGEKEVKFVFLGDGECFEEVRALSSELGLDPWVSFPGYVPESTVFSYLATADLGMDASLQEDVSPVKVFEYLAFGVPFVSFDLRETRSVGADAGAYVTPGDVQGLAQMIVALLADPVRRAAMGRAGRERVSSELAWEHQGWRYLAVMDRASRRERWVSPDDRWVLQQAE